MFQGAAPQAENTLFGEKNYTWYFQNDIFQYFIKKKQQIKYFFFSYHTSHQLLLLILDLTTDEEEEKEEDKNDDDDDDDEGLGELLDEAQLEVGDEEEEDRHDA